MHCYALLALVAAAAAMPQGASIPACGWTTALVSGTMVPVPLASTDCSSMAGSVTQISDGQVQAPSGAVTQISDGQVQAPSGAVTQISDGQIQAPTAVPAPCTEIVDGQPQCPTAVPACTEIVDGQPQCPSGAPAPTPAPPYPMSTGGMPSVIPTGTGAMPVSSYSVTMATGAGPTNGPVMGLLGAAAFAVALL